MHPPQSSHTSHALRQTHISPSFPQVWTVLGDNVVDNTLFGVRFGRSVRLSPSVDYLWMKSRSTGASTYPICGRRAASCEYPKRHRRSCTTVHSRPGRGSTLHPHLQGLKLRPTRRLIHTVPSPYDDDYIDISDRSHRPSKIPRWITALMSDQALTNKKQTAQRKGELS